ncbi:MAG TPA: hypothetical protein VJR92_04390 [Gemmatimonadaceae bacterium]|nr:hypothetical protein [Gemmatimonadaceae bacterium]
MSLLRMIGRVARRAAVFGIAVVATTLSCSSDSTGPGSTRLSNNIAFLTEFPTAAQIGGSALVPFNRVRVLLVRQDESTAIDTVVNYPATGELTLTLRVPLAADTPPEGLPLAMTLEYINAAGDVVFRAGPTIVYAVPIVPGAPPPEPVSLQVDYVGPGANAASVAIAEQPFSVLAGAGFTFTAVAFDGQAQPIPGTPIAWRSLDPLVANITSPVAGTGTALSVRGSARIVAELLTGQADTVVVGVLLPPATITVVSGSGQNAGIAQTLPQPLIVEVKASDGVPVPGVTVTFAVTGGGGSVGTPSAITDANGRAQTTWLLGALVGAQSVSATVAGIATPATFSATAASVGPTALQFVTGPSTVTAGIPISPAPMVAALDGQGATVTSFTGPITLALGANPGGATLSGTLTVNAVAGIATFNNVRLNRNAAAYTLVASSPSLTNATSSGFTVNPAPPLTVDIVSGGSQVAALSALLPQPLVIAVRDSLGNGVPGISVTWGPVFGGGALGGAGTLTDATGQSSRTWTLGATVGNQSVDVSASWATPPFGGAVFFTATAVPPGVDKVWTGAVSASWTNANNWSPAGVPTAASNVGIFPIDFDPVLASSTTIASLSMGSGATLNLTSVLTVSGKVDAEFGSIIGTGSLVLSGSGTLAVTTSTTTAVFVDGNYTLSGSTETGPLEVKGTLDFDQFGIVGTGTFQTNNTGTIKMAAPSAGLLWTGNMFFNGGDESGLLTAGIITVTGNFTQSAVNSNKSFVAAEALSLIFTEGGAQTINFATPDTATLSPVCAASCAGTLSISKTGGTVTFLSAASARGTFSVDGPITVNSIGAAGSPRVITVGSTFASVDPVATVRITRLRLASTPLLNLSTTTIDTIGFVGNASQTIPGNLTFGVVQILGSPFLNGPLTTTGDLIVANGSLSTGILTLGGFRVNVGGNLLVTNGGTVVMAGATDSLVVAGNAVFNGGPNSMTGGVLVVGGNFSQGGVGAVFAASGTHKTVLNGAGLQAVGFADPVQSFFRRLFVEKSSGSVNLATSVAVNGVFRASTSVTGASPVRLTADTLWGAIGSNVTPFVFELKRQLADSGTFSPDTVVFLDGLNTSIQLNFAGFGNYVYKSIRAAKLINTISFGAANLSLQNDLVISSGTLITNGAKVAVNGGLRTEGGGALQMTGAGDSVGVAGDVNFAGGSTSTIMTNGVLTVGGNFSQGGVTSSFAATANHRTKFQGAAAGFHTIVFTNPTTSFFRDLILLKPAGSGQEIRLFSNVLVTDSMTVQGGTDLTSSTNQRLQVQGRFIYVGGGGPVVRPFVLELTTIGPALDSTQINLPKFRPDTLVFLGTANYTLPFSNYTALRSVRVATTGIVDMFVGSANDTLGGDLHISSGRFQLNSSTTLVQKLRTTNTGALGMSGGQITVRDSTIFGGGNVNPNLIGGTIRAMGHFVQTGVNSTSSFNADPPHTVEFAGTSSQNVSFGTGGFGTTLSHFGNLRITNTTGVNFQSNVLTHVLVDLDPLTQPKVFGNGFTLTAEGVNVRNMLFDNTLVSIVDNQPITAFDTVTFQNYPTNPNILTVARSAPITPQFNGMFFPTVGFTGRYIVVNDPNLTTGGTFGLVITQATPVSLPLAQCQRLNGATLSWNFQPITGC